MPIGVNVLALSFITGHDILGMLHSWESMIRQERKLTPPALLPPAKDLMDEISTAIKFQQIHLSWSGTQDWIGDFATELSALHRQGMTAAREFVDKARRISCPGETSEGRCANSLVINEEDPLDIFECRKCQTQWTTLRLVAVALSEPNRKVWLDAEAIGRWLGISDRQVRRIAKANCVAHKGSLYDFNAIRIAHMNA